MEAFLGFYGAGIDMLFNSHFSYKELKHEWLHRNHQRGPSMKGVLCIPHYDLLCPAPFLEEFNLC